MHIFSKKPLKKKPKSGSKTKRVRDSHAHQKPIETPHSKTKQSANNVTHTPTRSSKKVRSEKTMNERNVSSILQDEQYNEEMRGMDRKSKMVDHQYHAVISLATAAGIAVRGAGSAATACKAAVASSPFLVGMGLTLGALSIAYLLWSYLW